MIFSENRCTLFRIMLYRVVDEGERTEPDHLGLTEASS
jgi:hypothetical protein